MKNRKLLLIVSLVLALTMSLGGTLAYLQDSDADVNVMTLGSVTITQNEHQRAKKADGTYETATIDNVTSYVLEVYENDKPLLPTTEIKADGTPDNHGAGGWDETTVRMTQIGSYGGMQVFKSENAVDKFVTVTNTGKSDAYVRTLVAVEAGSTDGSLVGTSYHNNWEMKLVGKVTIDNNDYIVTEYVYKGASDGSRHVNGVLPAGDTTYPSLAQVYLKSVANNQDMIDLDGNNNGKLDILVLSQAIQTNGFADAATALKAGFGEVNAENVQKWFGDLYNEDGTVNEEMIGTPGDKNETNDVPVIAEITVDSVEALVKAVNDGYTVIGLADNEYDIAGLAGKKGITLIGSKDAVLKLKNEGEDGCDYAFGSGGAGVGEVTFNGVTIDTTSNTGNYKGFAYMKGTFNNCNFVGAYSLNNANDFVFNNCTFDFKNGYLWTWAANSATFNGCTFNGNSKCILAHGSASTVITINNCDFAATEKGYASGGTVWTAAVEIDPTSTNTYTINFTGENTINENYAGWTRIKDDSTGHTITGLN